MTQDEAIYFNEKYGTSFEYVGMEAYKDSIGVFAVLQKGLKPMGITKPSITEERPELDLGQNAMKQHVQNFLAYLKKPTADREIVDSVQNYCIYDGRHADEQFKKVAKFTIYSNLELEQKELTLNDMQIRKLAEFTEPIDPKNIFVFKVHRGIGCRYIEYMYSKISYMQSELDDYISHRLVDEGYIDANINQKLSDEELFKAIDKLKLRFKLEKLSEIRQNKEKYIYTNVISADENVKMTANVRKIAHVTALDLSVEAEPGEYAFIIRNPETEQCLKQLASSSDNKAISAYDISVLPQGAFFFTIK